MNTRTAGLLAAAAAVYIAVAWTLPPGLYEGCNTPVDYRWLVTPPGHVNAGRPDSASVTTVNGRGPFYAATFEPAGPQAALSWVPNAFAVDPTARVTVTIDPVLGCPPPPRTTFESNVYRVATSAPINGNARLYLEPGSFAPAPSTIYFTPPGSCAWMPVQRTGIELCGQLSASISSAGDYVAGLSEPLASAGAGVRGPALPYIVAGAIVLVLVAGLPLAIVRRRR